MVRSLLFLLLLACSSPLAEAQKADTIEAYEQYLATKPSGSDAMIASNRLSELWTARAREKKVVEDYNYVIKTWPKHRELKALKEERTAIAFADAEKANTPEAWKKFLDENKDADKRMKETARDRVAVTEYAPFLDIPAPTISRVNLAEDPKGPKNGWGFESVVTNKGDKEINYLYLELKPLDKNGVPTVAIKYPLVASSGPGGLPITPGYEKPLKPGESRKWSYAASEEDLKGEFGEKAELRASKIRFAGTPANDGAKTD